MSEKEQPIHLYLGDQYAAGLRPIGDAGVYATDDFARPILKWITGGTQQTSFDLPSLIINNEWSFEHIIPFVMDPVSASFTPRVTQANIHVAITDAEPSELQSAGSIRSQVDTALARVSIEGALADRQAGILFLLNGDTSFSGSPARVVPHGIRPGSKFETEGFVLRINPTHNFSDVRADALIQLDANNKIELPLTSGENALRVTVGGSADITGTWQSGAGIELDIVVDWVRKLVSVYPADTGQLLASVALTNGNWSGLETTDATFGHYDGTINAPQKQIVYADPRVDFCLLQFGAEIGNEASATAESEAYITAINQMRNEPWGRGMPVWIILPPEDIPTAGSALRGRAGMLMAAAALDNVFVIETRHLTRVTVSGDDVLNGASMISLAEDLTRDWKGIVDANLRFMGRPRHTGFRRFENAADANTFIQELIDAGLTTRDVAPHLGGPGERAGSPLDGPWALAKTTRESGDHYADPNTGERLVPIDLAAAQAGFTAPARGIRIVPSTAGAGFIADQFGPETPEPIMDFRDLTTTRATEANHFDPVSGKMRWTSGNTALVASLSLDPADVYTVVGGATVTTGQDDPAGLTAGVLMEDTSNVLLGEVRTTGGVAVSVTDPLWIMAWVKRDTGATTFCGLFAREGSSAVAGVYVDQSTGRISEFGTTQTSYIGRHGDWYFVAFRYPAGATAVNVGFYPAAGGSFPTTDITSTGTATFYGPAIANTTSIAERGSNVTPYAYNLQARWNRTGTCTIEGARTNELDETENFEDNAWSLVNATLARGNRGPDASPNTWILTDSDESNLGYAQATTPGSVGTGANTFSVFIKKDTSASHLAGIRIAQGAGEIFATLSLSDGTITSFGAAGGFADAGSSVDTIVGPDGEAWFRCNLSWTSTGAAVCVVRLYPAIGTVAGASNVAAAGSTEFFGPQVEDAAEFESTYIPSSGIPGTRAADDVTFTSSDVTGTFYTVGFQADYYPQHDADVAPATEVIVGFTGSATHYVQLNASGSNVIPAVRNGGVERTNGSMSYVKGDKITFLVEHGITTRVYKNDVLELTIDTSADGNWSSRSADTGHLGASGTGTNQIYGALAPVTDVPT